MPPDGPRLRGRAPAGGLRRALAALLLGSLFAAVLVVLADRAPAERWLVLAVDNGVQLVAAALAAAACARAALRGGSAHRRAWTLLAVGVGSWAAGQAVWTVYEVVLGREVPFPSFADAGFLVFPLVTSAGLLSWLRAGHLATAYVRDLLDGAVIACSLLLLSWVTTLSTIAVPSAGGWLVFVLSLAYPVGDVVMATLVLLALSRPGTVDRATLTLVASGLGGLALADSAYMYLVGTGVYGTGDVLSAGWVTGFLLIAAGAHGGGRSRRDGSAAGSDAVPDHAGARPHLLPHAVVPSRVAVVLPYIPLVLAGVAVLADLIRVRGTMSVQLGLGVGLVLLVVGRQFLALAENRRLLLELRDARDQLRQQALHDPLTGLANRSLFAERLQHALDPHGPRAPHIPRPGRAAARPSAGVAVLFCDLNDFKAVNDALGHGAGDELLRAVAQRLQAAAGPGHTVARLGGDEFAVLVDESADPLAVADRLVHAVGQPFVIDGVPVLVSVSVGVALAGDGSPEPRPTPDRWTRPSSDPARPLDPAVEQAARRLLQDADTAMYAAKAAGKGQVSVAPAR